MKDLQFFALCVGCAALAFGAAYGLPFTFFGGVSYGEFAAVTHFATGHSGDVRRMAGACVQPYSSKTLAINIVGDSLYQAMQKAKPDDGSYSTIAVAKEIANLEFEKEIRKSAGHSEALKKQFENSRTISVYVDPNNRTHNSVPESFRKELAAAGLPAYPSISEKDANKNYADYGQIRNFRNSRSDLEHSEDYEALVQSLSSKVYWNFYGIANCTIEKLATLASETAQTRTNSN